MPDLEQFFGAPPDRERIAGETLAGMRRATQVGVGDRFRWLSALARRDQNTPIRKNDLFGRMQSTVDGWLNAGTDRTPVIEGAPAQRAFAAGQLLGDVGTMGLMGPLFKSPHAFGAALGAGHAATNTLLARDDFTAKDAAGIAVDAAMMGELPGAMRGLGYRGRVGMAGAHGALSSLIRGEPQDAASSAAAMAGLQAIFGLPKGRYVGPNRTTLDRFAGPRGTTQPGIRASLKFPYKGRVFHGTDKEFKLSKVNPTTYDMKRGPGFYTTVNPWEAKKYAGGLQQAWPIRNGRQFDVAMLTQAERGQLATQVLWEARDTVDRTMKSIKRAHPKDRLLIEKRIMDGANNAAMQIRANVSILDKWSYHYEDKIHIAQAANRLGFGVIPKARVIPVAPKGGPSKEARFLQTREPITQQEWTKLQDAAVRVMGSEMKALPLTVNLGAAVRAGEVSTPADMFQFFARQPSLLSIPQAMRIMHKAGYSGFTHEGRGGRHFVWTRPRTELAEAHRTIEPTELPKFGGLK